MNIVIVTPAPANSTLGNSITANRWAQILRSLGHKVDVTANWDRGDCELLVALHARRSNPSIEKFRQAYPNRPLIVALTGTDLYGDLRIDPATRRSLSLADRIIALQERAAGELEDESRDKLCVIYQSAVPPPLREPPDNRFFEVCVLSHLREVKDPLRAAAAARRLPAESSIKILHAGRALEPEWGERAKEEERMNPRYVWLGDLDHDDALAVLARSRLLVLSSLMEGGASAIAEAVVCGVPILCSNIPGNVGMLGPEYQGYYPPKDTHQLADLLYRAECDSEFLQELQSFCSRLRYRFNPEQETESWKCLLAQL